MMEKGYSSDDRLIAVLEKIATSLTLIYAALLLHVLVTAAGWIH